MDYYLIVALILLATILVTSLRIADQYYRAVILRWGRYAGVRGPGFYFLLPWGIERPVIVDMRVTTWNLPQQEAITKDNVPVAISAVLWTRVENPEVAALKVDGVENAIRQFSATSIRAIVGMHDLDDVLSSGGTLSTTLAERLRPVAIGWGMKVEQAEILNVEIPESMQRAIAQKAEATREREARVIRADAEFMAATKLCEAAELISRNPEALELRRLQMMTEIGAEQNTMMVVMIPSEFVSAARTLSNMTPKKQES